MNSINFLNIIQVLVAIALIGFILIQRGPGATAGSAFGGGASGTVFGAKGSGSFLTKTTAILATLFFIITMVMAINARNLANPSATNEGETDLGVMGTLTEKEADVPSVSATPGSTVVPENTTNDDQFQPDMSRVDEPLVNEKKDQSPDSNGVNAQRGASSVKSEGGKKTNTLEQEAAEVTSVVKETAEEMTEKVLNDAENAAVKVINGAEGAVDKVKETTEKVVDEAASQLKDKKKEPDTDS